MAKCASARFSQSFIIFCILAAVFGAAPSCAFAAAPSSVVKSITIRAPRDMGFFAGDLIKVNIDLVVSDGYVIEPASLPHPGAIDYWLDLCAVDVEDHRDQGDRRYTLKLIYQNFYDALDARPQEMPAFTVLVKKGDETITVDVPAWTIGVSALREVAPPVKEDPKDYMRADQSAPYMKTNALWIATSLMSVMSLAAVALLAFDRAWWPFHARPARVFGHAARQLRKIRSSPVGDETYLNGLLILHRGIDQTDGQRVLADDLPEFLSRHPIFSPLEEGLALFFTASRLAFFGSDPARARAALSFRFIETFAQKLAAMERMQP